MTTGPDKFKTYLKESAKWSSLAKDLRSVVDDANDLFKAPGAKAHFTKTPIDAGGTRLMAGLDDACQKFEDYLAMPQIPGPRFNEVVGYFKSFFENFYEWTTGSYPYILFLRELEATIGRDDPKFALADDVYYATKGLTYTPLMLRKIDAALAKFPDNTILKIAKRGTLIGIEIKKAIDEAKPKLVKGRVVDPNKVSDKFVPTFTVDSYKKIHEEMERQLAAIRKDHEEAIYGHYEMLCKKVIAEMESMPPKSTSYAYMQKSNYIRQPGLARDLYYAISDNSRYGEDLKVKDNWKEIVRKRVVRDIEGMYNTFMAKNARKLAAIVDKMKDMPQIKSDNKIQGISLVNRMWLSFANGASFEVTNSIDYVINSFGTNFVRFPTRFTNVKLSSGLMMGSPSEEKMSKEFE